jgi:hypothetical protein
MLIVVNELKTLLKNIKTKIRRIDTENEFISFLDNYKKDEDLSRIEEIMKKEIDYKIIGKCINNFIGKEPKILFQSISDIQYKNYIDENPYFSAGIFFLPQNCKLPLHDHRNMLVFCKFLHGKAEIKSYDKIQNKDLDIP